MGDVTVPGLTEDELRDAAMSAVAPMVKPPLLAACEWTVKDWMAKWGISRSEAERDLAARVLRGELRFEERYDPRSRRAVNGYRKAEGK